MFSIHSPGCLASYKNNKVCKRNPYLCGMTRILHIDTASRFCSVALSDGPELAGLRETSEKNAHARVTTVFIDELIKDAKLKPEELDAIAVSMGPGSYTGLRIGVSTAKGLCYALGKPLIAVSTLQSMAVGSIRTLENEGAPEPEALFCPMIDARRMEVYSAIYNHQGKIVREVRAEVIDENSFTEELATHKIIFSGEGSEKCKTLLSHQKNAIFREDIPVSAKFMIPIALGKFNNREFEDTAYFEPFYLKEFVAGKPRVKGLK